MSDFYEDDEEEGDVMDTGYYYQGKKQYHNIKDIFEDAMLTFYHIIPTGYKRSGYFYSVKDLCDVAKLMYGVNDFEEKHWVVVYLASLGPTKKEIVVDLFNSDRAGCEIKSEMFEKKEDAMKFYQEILADYVAKTIEKRM